MREKSFYLVYGRNFKLLKIIENNRLNLKERWLFCKQLKLLTSSGMKATEALGIMQGFFERKTIKNSIEEIRKKVYLGENISEAMVAFKRIYPNFLINMIKLGEDNGNLEEVLEKLELYYENQWKISSKIKEIIIYPMFLVFFSIIIIIFLSSFILPQFQIILRDFNGQIPTFTKVILSSFEFLRNNKLVILIFLSINVILIIYKLKKSFINIKYEILRNTPFLKTLYYKLQSYNILMCLWMTLKCGLNIDKALEEVCLIIEDDKIVKRLRLLNSNIIQGSTIGEAFEKSLNGILRKDMFALIKMGEESGNLENILKDMCNMIKEEIIIKVNSSVKLIEPIIILIVSIHIGILVIALFLPIIGVMDGITNI